ncbi:MAG: chemotaxis protein CheA [Betaproteobacteria bacterium]|nr:chemotaxis protein CheA [Betaproteobacteria bacterium]
MIDDLSQFHQVFFDEATELLAEMERLLLEVDVASPSQEELNAIFRAAHSIKGGAATFGFTDISEFTHVLESLLDKIRKGEMALTAEHVDTFLAAKDIMAMLLEGHRAGGAVDLDQVAEVSRRLHALADPAAGKQAAAPVAAAAPEPEPEPVAQPATTVAPASGALAIFRIELPVTPDKDVEGLAAELGLLGTLTREPLPDGRMVFHLETDQTQSDVTAVCSFVVDADKLLITAREPAVAAAASVAVVAEPAAVPVAAAAAAVPVTASQADAAVKAAKREAGAPAGHESSSIRVSIEKVDLLINLVGELVITQAMIDQRVSTLDPVNHEALLNNFAQLARNTRDLQESVMSIRMIQMDYVFSRFPRMVRELASKLGKKVDFITQGASTELDKGLIERIIDPLTHLVRNSIDHGFELPAERLQAGKPEAGKLVLSASHQGGNIVIEVIDDGRGLNRARILDKARQNGLPVSDNMTDEDVWQLIFMPGFSTADVVTDVSGRGVGMDVVRRNITDMGGTVEVRSVAGQGSSVRISVPLTLAILDGMSVKVGTEVYIVPLAYVVESLQPGASELKEMAGQGRLIKVRDEYLPLVYLYERFGIVPKYAEPTESIVLVLGVDDKKFALLVDTLVGQQQVVVKNLETNFRKVPGISGATILGDGGVSLILDVSALMRGLA